MRPTGTEKVDFSQTLKSKQTHNQKHIHQTTQTDWKNHQERLKKQETTKKKKYIYTCINKNYICSKDFCWFLFFIGFKVCFLGLACATW
jgi:hypothetical protein